MGIAGGRREADPFDVARGLVDEDEEATPTLMNPCPDCGSELVIIGIRGVPPPSLSSEIWITVFGRWCVRAREWRWCRAAVSPSGHVKGHLEMEGSETWIAKP
jgi:hypothetical protein